MNRKSIRNYFIIILIFICSIVYFKWQVPPYKIAHENVKSIYCTFYNNDGEHRIEVKDIDREIILSEVSKMKRSGIKGQVGTIGYHFTIELFDGNEFVFYQNTSKTVSLEKDHFFRNIKAPKTAIFIKKFIAEHNIEI